MCSFSFEFHQSKIFKLSFHIISLAILDCSEFYSLLYEDDEKEGIHNPKSS